MRREHAVDVIRAELQRQTRAGALVIDETKTPDQFTIIGVVDVHEIAKAIEDATHK